MSHLFRAAPEGDKAVKGQKSQPLGEDQSDAKKGKEAIGPKRGSQVCCYSSTSWPFFTSLHSSHCTDTWLLSNFSSLSRHASTLQSPFMSFVGARPKTGVILVQRDWKGCLSRSGTASAPAYCLQLCIATAFHCQHFLKAAAVLVDVSWTHSVMTLSSCGAYMAVVLHSSLHACACRVALDTQWWSGSALSTTPVSPQTTTQWTR